MYNIVGQKRKTYTPDRVVWLVCVKKKGYRVGDTLQSHHTVFVIVFVVVVGAAATSSVITERNLR